jgi:hypothetical protein
LFAKPDHYTPFNVNQTKPGFADTDKADGGFDD